MANQITTLLDNQLTQTLDRQLANGQLDSARRTLIQYKCVLQASCTDAISTIVSYMSDENFSNQSELYMGCEMMLQEIAEDCPIMDVFFELIELIETTRSDNLFVSALKSIQICLKRQSGKNVNYLEWCFNSILTYISALPVPDSVLENQNGAATAALFEENDQVRRVLGNYLTLFLFCEPFLTELEKERALCDVMVFRCTKLTGHNVILTFLLQLLGKPLYYLNLQRPEQDGDVLTVKYINTYSWQSAKSIVQHILNLCPDPVFLLAYTKLRVICPVQKRSRAVFELDAEASRPGYIEPQLNVFATEEKSPMLCIAILFYLLFVERLMPTSVPQIYTGRYIFEGCLYLIAAMLETNIHALHEKALRLTDFLLRQYFQHADNVISTASLDLHIHRQFSTQLCRVITESPCRQNSQHGAQILRTYVLSFDDTGRHAVIFHLLSSVQHNGLRGHLIGMYKDIVADELRYKAVIPTQYSGERFRIVVLQFICRLESGPETDLLKNSDQLISALNALYFFLLADRDGNRTGLRNFLTQVEGEFVVPLRRAIELTRSHYDLEKRRVLSEMPGVECDIELSIGHEALGPIDRKTKLKMLHMAITSFDLMENLLVSVESEIRQLIENNKAFVTNTNVSTYDPNNALL